jgi:glycosyltransferase involved in cell wall biosynthesis
MDAPCQRILIDGRKIHDGGIGRYIVNLVDGLLHLCEFSITLMCFPKDNRFVENKWQNRVKTLPCSLALYSLQELFLFRSKVDWSCFDVLHVPHFTVPFAVPVPVVATVHDLIQITHPERWYYSYIARWYIHNAIKKAQALIAVSNHTSQELLSFGANASVVKVIPNSVGIGSSNKANNFDFLLPNFVPGFLLTVVSNNKPHKGLNRLMSAYQYFQDHSLERSSLPDVGLVVVGQGATVGAFPGGISVGPVSEEELQWYYKNARAIVVPSDTEGFCLPIIEAREHGVGTVCTPIPAVRELLGPTDCMAKDFSSHSLAQALSEYVARSAPNRNDVKKLNDRFSAVATATEVACVYRNVSANKKLYKLQVKQL